MTAVPYWVDSPDSWDSVSIAGEPLPGRSTIKGKVARKMDVRSVRGADGARTRDGGYDPAKITIEVEVWEPEQLKTLQRRIAELHPRVGGTARTAFDVAHPALSLVGITSAYVDSITLPEVTGPGGALKTTITMIEWTQAPPRRPRNTPPAPTTENAGTSAFEQQERADQSAEYRSQLRSQGEPESPTEQAQRRLARARPPAAPRVRT